MYQQTDSDKLQGSIRIPIETETEFQRAFNASFDRLPFEAKSLRLNSSMKFHASSGFLLGMVRVLLPMDFDNLGSIIYSHKEIYFLMKIPWLYQHHCINFSTAGIFPRDFRLHQSRV